MDATIAAAFVSGISTVVAAAVNFLGQRGGRDKRSGQGGFFGLRSPVWAALVIALAAVSVATFYAAMSSDEDSIRTVDIESISDAADIVIDEPRDGVPVCPALAGTGDIPEGTQLWLAARASDGDYYLSEGPARQEGNHQWVLPEGFISLGVGSPEEVGAEWEIRALLLEEWASVYLADLRTSALGEPRELTADLGPFSQEPPPAELLVATGHVVRNADVNC